MDDQRRNRNDAGFSMLLTVISLLITAVLILFALTTMFKSSGNGSTKLTNEPGVGMADDLAAQQALQTSLTAADAVAAASGGYGSVTSSALSASNPSITYVDAPGSSSSSSTVSVASSSASPSGGGAGGVAGLGDGSDQGGGGSGSVTLAVRASTGNCWLAWKGAGGVTWFGEQTGLTSCHAVTLGSAPTAGAVSSSAIGWRQGAFPSGA